MPRCHSHALYTRSSIEEDTKTGGQYFAVGSQRGVPYYKALQNFAIFCPSCEAP